MKLLEELWNGNILPYEREAAPKSRLRHIGRLIVRNEEELDPLLSEKAKEVFEKLKENQAARTCLSECEVFVYGFRLGARIMLEVMDDSGRRFETEE